MTPQLRERSDLSCSAECDPALICMYYVYLLSHKQTGELYYGYTQELAHRITEHKRDDSWQLIYYEAYASEVDARAREQKLKQYGQARTHLKRRLGHSLRGQISAGFNSHSNLCRPDGLHKLRAH